MKPNCAGVTSLALILFFSVSATAAGNCTYDPYLNYTSMTDTMERAVDCFVFDMEAHGSDLATFVAFVFLLLFLISFFYYVVRGK